MAIASNRAVLSQWQELFHRLNIGISAWELEIIAVYRGIYDSLPEQPVCLVDMKDDKTIVSIFTSQGLAYSYIYFLGYRKILSALGFSKQEKEAAKYFREKNIVADKPGDKMSILIEKLKEVNFSINKNIKYFKEKQKLKVSELVLVGKFYKFNGLDKYFNELNPQLRVRLGKPMIKNLKTDFLAVAGGTAKNILNRKLIPSLSLDLGGLREKSGLRLKKKRLLESISFPKIKLKPSYLIISTLIVFFVLAGALSITRDKKPSSESDYQHHLKYELGILVDLNSKTNAVNGEVVSVLVKDAMIIKEATEAAINKASSSLGHDRVIDPNPLNLPDSEEAIVFPFTFEFFSYSKKLAHSKCLEELKAQAEGIDYVIADIAISSSRKSQNIFELVCQLELYTKAKAQIKSKEIKVEEKKDIVTVRENISGNVNIRSGPGINYEIISQTRAGDKYELIQEKDAWTEIVIKEGGGWIISSAIKKSE